MGHFPLYWYWAILLYLCAAVNKRSFAWRLFCNVTAIFPCIPNLMPSWFIDSECRGVSGAHFSPPKEDGEKNDHRKYTSAYWPIILLYITLFFTFFVAVIDWLGTHFFCIPVSHNSEKPNSKVQKTSQGCVCRIVTKTFRQQFTENWKWTTPFCDWSIPRARLCREPL